MKNIARLPKEERLILFRNTALHFYPRLDSMYPYQYRK